MAIQFNKTAFVVTVECNTNPIEDWTDTRDELIDVLQCLDADLTAGRKYSKVLELLRCMMPDMEMAKKML